MGLCDKIRPSCPTCCQCCCHCGGTGHEPIAGNDDEDREPVKSSVPMTVFNTINSILGSGVIAIPYGIREAGIGLGVILLILVGLITDYSLILLIRAGELSKSPRPTYQSVMTEVFGMIGFGLISLVQFLYPFMAMISYNVIIGDNVTKVLLRVSQDTLRGTILSYRQVVTCVVTALVTLPLSLYRDIAKLSKWATLSISIFLVIVVFVAVRMATLHIPPTDDAWTFAAAGTPKAIGIFAFAYICHHNSFLMYESLQESNSSNWSKVVHTSLAFSIQGSLILGLLGYITFTGRTEGDLFENYCQDDDMMNVGRFFFAIVVMITYPVECFVTREVVENAIFPNHQPPTMRRHVFITLVIVIATLLLSFLTDCLGIIIEFNGLLTGAPMAFIFPPMLVLKLQNKPIFSLSNIFLLLTIAFGAVSSIIGLTMAIIEIVHGVTCSHGIEPEYCFMNSTDLEFNISALSSLLNVSSWSSNQSPLYTR